MSLRNPIILDKPEDWPAWIEEVGSSVPDEIWLLVDPDGNSNEEFLAKPTKTRVQEINGTKTLNSPHRKGLYSTNYSNTTKRP